MRRSTRPWPASCAAAAPRRAFGVPCIVRLAIPLPRHEAPHFPDGCRRRPERQLHRRLHIAGDPQAAGAAGRRRAVVDPLRRRPLHLVHAARRDGPEHRHRVEAGGLRGTGHRVGGARPAVARHGRHPPRARHRGQRLDQGLCRAAGAGLRHLARRAGRRAHDGRDRGAAAARRRTACLRREDTLRRPGCAHRTGRGAAARRAAVCHRRAPPRHALRPRAARAGVAGAAVAPCGRPTRRRPAPCPASWPWCATTR